MFDLGNPELFVKGTCEVWAFNPRTGDLDFHSPHVQTNQFNTSVNLGPINAGLGNPTVIQIPDTAKLELKLTVADFSLEARALQVGAEVSFNGVEPVDEVVEAVGTKLTVGLPPCAPLGSGKIECRVNKSGKAYLINATTREVQGFAATTGTKYCVHYSHKNPSAKQMGINAAFSPAVERVLTKMAVYDKQGAKEAKYGSLCGHIYNTVPRMQFNADATTDGSQTTPATTVLDGSALSYDEADANGLDCGMTANQPKLAYMVYVPLGLETQDVAGLAAAVGGEIAVKVGQIVQCPAKYVMPDDTLVTPNYSDLTYTVTATATATVSATGEITGKAVGDTEITVTKAGTTLKGIANVSVKAAG